MNDTDKIIEHELISRLKNGSQEAFDAIYGMYARKLYAYCLQYTKSRVETEEIVQDVFVRLWLNKSKIRQEDSLRSLLFTMSKYRLINAYKARLHSPVYEDYVNYQDRIATGGQAEKLEYEEFVMQLKEILHQLPDTQRRVIELSRFEQLSNKEIAAQLQLNEQTVKNQLSLGLKTLREKLNHLPLLFYLLFTVNSSVIYGTLALFICLYPKIITQ